MSLHFTPSSLFASQIGLDLNFAVSNFSWLGNFQLPNKARSITEVSWRIKAGSALIPKWSGFALFKEVRGVIGRP